MPPTSPPAGTTDVPSDLPKEQREWLGGELRHLANAAIKSGEPKFKESPLNREKLPWSAAVRVHGTLSQLVIGGQISADQWKRYEDSLSVTVSGGPDGQA